MRLHTFEDIRRTVPPAALDKATIYQRGRRAFVTDMAEDGTLVQGRVQGTQRRPYTVTVELGVGPDGRVKIDSSCSCPVGFNCKHVAALLIESMATPEGRKLAPSIAGPVLPPQAESWLAELDRAMALSEDAYPPSIRQRLIYVLSIADDISGPPQPVLELKSVRLLKDDSFSATVSNYDPQSAFSSTPAKFLRGNDIPILRRLHLRGGGRGHSLSGETGAEVLGLVLATSRCRWRSLEGPVMALGVPRRGSIGWTMLDNGAQKPAVSVEGAGTAVCLIPPWYVDAEAAACGPLQIDVPPQVAAMLMHAPAVEPQQVAALRGKLAERLPGHSELLPAEPPAPEVIAGPPTPVLQLARRTLKPAFSGYTGRASWAGPSAPQDLQVARASPSPTDRSSWRLTISATARCSPKTAACSPSNATARWKASIERGFPLPTAGWRQSPRSTSMRFRRTHAATSSLPTTMPWLGPASSSR